MGQLKSAPDSLYFCSLIYRQDLWDEWQIKEKLAGYFCSQLQLISDYNPSLNYYTQEMGDLNKLRRLIWCETMPRPRDWFLTLKLFAQKIEQQTSRQHKRTLNLDIGQLNLENILLASSKPYSHRIYMGAGVYSELCYLFQKQSYQPLPWTYPDYQHQQKIDFFQSCRQYLI